VELRNTNYLINHLFAGPITLFNDENILPSLEIVVLRNNSLSGTIPVTLFTRPAMQELDLWSNNFSGPIGEFHNPSAMLTIIDLGSNQLTGAVPTSFSQLKALAELVLYSNNFTGTWDLNPYFRLRNLKLLLASGNPLLSVTADDHGSNTSSYNNSGISCLSLAGCNLTRIPGALRYLPQLDITDLSGNRISGRVPDWIWRKAVTYLDLSHNKFTTVGQIPANTSVSQIDLSFNKLRGVVPLPSSVDLECRQNYSFFYLDLSGNYLTGLIPPYLLKGCNDLRLLNLRGNRLSGTWPDEMDPNCNLTIIDLHGNRLEGPLPRSLIHCKELRVLDVGGNNFMDVFPKWLGYLPHLELLDLRSNKFYGQLSIPPGLNHSTTSYFRSVQIIGLAENGFTGVIPSELFNNFEFMMWGQKPHSLEALGPFRTI
jgi:Leucine-rich repeat (LRR) protein